MTFPNRGERGVCPRLGKNSHILPFFLLGSVPNCVVLHDIVSYFTVLSFIDTVEVILSDWRDTGAGLTENLRKKNWLISLSPLL